VVAAPTCLWAGLLLSRLFWSVRERAEPAGVMRASIALMAAAAVLLVLRPESLAVAVGALGLGFGIGPVYPLLLDTVLRYTRGGPIFFLAGVGSACLPWLTGTFSSANGSLRIGLLVPTCASVLLLLLAFASPLRQWVANRTPTSSAL
jgi:fucose permease